MADEFPTSSTLPPDTPNGNWLARNRRFAILGGVLVVVAIAAGVAAYLRRPTTPALINATPLVNSTTSTPSDGRTTFRRYSVPVIHDQDGEGLSDEDEAKAKTNVKISDTDGDGLSDYEEVKIYKSNPTVQDTDKDGTSDGIEVKRGDNPLGPGTLRDLPKAIQQTKP